MVVEAKTFMVEDAQIIFRNFEGKENQFNTKGHREFSVVLTQELADQLLEDGWNVKYLKAREEGDEETPIISVTVKFDIRPPRIVLITSGGRTQLDADTVEILDYADIKLVDLICSGYDWVLNGKSGTKAYLQTMFVTINEDALEQKYQIHKDPAN